MNLDGFICGRVRAAMASLVIALCFAQTPALATSAAAARVWFYRDLNPYESLAEPYVRIDGAAVGVSVPGTAFYRDITPGRHILSVDSYATDPTAARAVDIPPGGEVFAKIVPLDNFVESGGEFSGGYHRNNYVLWLYPPEVARAAIARGHTAAAIPR